MMNQYDAIAMKQAAQKWVEAEVFFAHAVHLGYQSNDLKKASTDAIKAREEFLLELEGRTVDVEN